MNAREFEEHARTLIFKPQGIAALASQTQFAAPSQIEMRQAISAAYYAVFHGLTSNGTRLFAAGGDALCYQAARAYNHTALRKVCEAYARLPNQPLPPTLASLNPKPVDPRITDIAKTFVRLQDGRHHADYDLSVAIEFVNAAELVNAAGAALTDLDAIQSFPETTTFLAALLLADRWTRRG